MPTVKKTTLEGVRIIRGTDLFRDLRGVYRELYCKKEYRKKGIGLEFVSHTMSQSKRHVLRGIHGDTKNWKLISCISGSFCLVVVNNMPGSKQYRQWEMFTLTEDENTQILVPPRFGNGHLILSTTAIFHYLQSNYYVGQKNQFTIRWDDPKFGIPWPIHRRPILSARDAEAPYVE